MLTKDGDICEITSTTSDLSKELQTIPVLRTLSDLYSKTRDSHWLLQRSLVAVESSYNAVSSRVYVGTKLECLDNLPRPSLTLICHSATNLRHPFMPGVKVTDLLIQMGQEVPSKVVRKTSKRLLKSYPGQKFANGLNWAIDASERLLWRVSPRTRIPSNVVWRNNNSPTKDKNREPYTDENSKEPVYATEDSGAYDTSESKSAHKPTLSDLKALKKLDDEPKGLLMKAYHLGVVFPLKTVVALLKWVRVQLGIPAKRKRSERKRMTPDKEAEIRARKKVSPRKKVTSSFIDNIKNAAFKVIGYRGRPYRRIKMDSVSGSEGLSPGRDDAEKKRKHDEILTDNGSDLESESGSDLAYFDIDDYKSEEDPDYEPSEESVDSEEISDGDTESDIEVEEVAAKSPGSDLVQIKGRMAKDKKPEIKLEHQRANDATKQETEVKKDTSAPKMVEKKEPIHGDKTNTDPAQKDQTLKDQAKKDHTVNEQSKKDQPAKDQSKKDQPQKDRPKKDPQQKDQSQKDPPQKDQHKKDQPQKDQPQKDQSQKDPPPKDQPKKDPSQKDQPKKDQQPKDPHTKEQPQKDQPKKDQSQKEQPNKDSAQKDTSINVSPKQKWNTTRELEK